MFAEKFVLKESERIATDYQCELPLVRVTPSNVIDVRLSSYRAPQSYIHVIHGIVT